MKVNTPTASLAKARCPPPIPLERAERKAPQKDECIMMKLHSNPTNESSQVYEIVVKYFSTGTAKEWFRFRKDLDRVLVGQNITEPDAKYSMTRRLLEGDAQAKFDEAVTTHGEMSDENYTKVMDAVATHVLPVKGLAYQKRYMRRFMRKPSNMKIREFVAHVNELNNYLKQFPPKAENQELQPDELKTFLSSRSQTSGATRPLFKVKIS